MEPQRAEVRLVFRPPEGLGGYESHGEPERNGSLSMPDSVEIVAIVSAALFGAAVGSFLNVCVYRLPRQGLRVSRPARSFCPACGFRIPWYDNVPLVSWILLGGRCRSCRGAIAPRYLLVEALTAMLFAVVVNRYVIQESGGWGGCTVQLSLISGLLVATFVDIDFRLIPDEITVGGMHLLPLAVLAFPDLQTRAVDGALSRLLVGGEATLRDIGAPVAEILRVKTIFYPVLSVLVVALFAAGAWLYYLYRRRFLPDFPRRLRDVSLAGLLSALVGGTLFTQLVYPEISASPRVYGVWSTLAGMLVGSALVYVVGVVGTRLFRKPAMGFGDVKLMGLLGAWAGWWGALSGFFLACLLGSLVGIVRLLIYRDRYLPFGPFLCVGCLLLALWPGVFQSLMRWYLDLFRA